MRSTYYPALDGFRAVAVLMVFSSHYLVVDLPVFRNWGWIGVDLFFVLSGFLITGILYDSRDKVHRFRDFYARRMLRIFPLYYGIWLAVLLAWPVFHWQWDWHWLFWPMHLGNLARFIFFEPSNFLHLDTLAAGRHTHLLKEVYMAPFWSLCIEEQFYLVWPLVVLLAPTRRWLIRLSVLVVVVEPFLRLVLYRTLPQAVLHADFLVRFTLTRLDSLVLGGLLALLLRGPEKEMLFRKGRLLTCSSLALFFVMWAEFVHRSHHFIANLHDPVVSTFGLSAIELMAAGIILEVIRPESRVGAWLQWPPLRKLGQVSYGFYVFHDLFHQVYLHIATRLGLDPFLATAAIGLSCTLTFSFLSYRFSRCPSCVSSRTFPDRNIARPCPAKYNEAAGSGICRAY